MSGRGVSGRTIACTLLATLSLAGCTHRARVEAAPVPVSLPPAVVTPVNPWPATLLAAQRSVERGEYEEADRALVEFGVSHPGTPEGAESDFFRALFKADPANRDLSLRTRLSALDAYLGAGAALPRYLETLVIRRLIETADSTSAQIAAVRAASEARDRAKDGEIQRLSDELEKTVAELERIKRRLAKP